MLIPMYCFKCDAAVGMLKRLDPGANDDLNTVLASRFGKASMQMISPDDPELQCETKMSLWSGRVAELDSPVWETGQFLANPGIKGANELVVKTPCIYLIQEDQIVADDLVDVPTNEQTRDIREHLDTSADLT